MGAAGSDWLERDERDQEENASLAVAKMPLTAQSVVADIGAGTGYYSFKIAQRVPQGKVYAVDIQDEMLMMAADQKRALGDTIVELIKSTDRTVNLPLNSIDLAIMVDVYHELEFPKETLQSLYIALKPTGKLLLIEYRGEDPTIPIKPLHKTTVDQLNKELQRNGFKLQQRGDFLPVQHFLLYEKIFDEVISIHSRLRKNFDNKDLNEALQNAINKNKIPVYSRFRPKIKYIKQVSTRPIIFKIFGNQANKLSLDYQKYLAKSLSKKFNIKGFKIFLRFVSAENPFKSKKY
jgi:ubiquinone/menaquinone biosynthesis C-methylase UbiE